MRTRRAWPALALLALAPAVRGEDKPPSAEGVEFFEKKVRPVLVKHCYGCHSADAKKVKGEYRLDTRAGVLAGGASGPSVVPGDPAKSLLVQAVRHADPAPQMPPDAKLKPEEVADLEAWVKMGAPDPRGGGGAAKAIDFEKAKEFWSFKPVVRPAGPKSVDEFIRAKLDAKGLKPAPPADKRTLVRRATFDLTGLPPTPEEVDAFLADDTPGAFARVVERLLASPAYGERWGRHWLDVVRYADTAGDNSDYPVPQIYKYRNWVIDAFNRDLPYDEFVRQQVAGDLLPTKDDADRHAKTIATGYLANTKRFGSYEDARYPWYLTYEDQIDNLGRTFLGLTVGCARCHDHKFDPVSQHDYYALYGFFSSTRYPRPGIELDKVQRDFVPLGPAEQVAAFETERAAKLKEFDDRVRRLEAEKKLAEKGLAEAGKLADEAERAARVAELNKEVDGFKGKIKAAQKESEDFARRPLPFETAYAVAEGKTEGKRKVGDACVQIKGDPERLGPEVPRRFLSVLGGQALPANETGSGRLHLANWIADAKNPLTARVMANRVWQYHFGNGLVRTASNFGALGLAPTHPELLDWLAAEFVAKGWSVKHLHRLVMLSGTYQQSGRGGDGDPGNELLARFDRRRLDAESIRDALLAAAGTLDRTPGGPHPFPDPKAWNFTQHNPFKAVYDTNRRSVYVMTQRFQRHPFFALFDGADTNAGTDRRGVSTTPLQALYLMNDPFVHAQAAALAKRVRGEGKDDAARVGRAYLLLFGRPPTTDEVAAAADYLAAVAKKAGGDRAAEAAWESLARALFLSNEFVYVD
jgi:cytochrome c553